MPSTQVRSVRETEKRFRLVQRHEATRQCVRAFAIFQRCHLVMPSRCNNGCNNFNTSKPNKTATSIKTSLSIYSTWTSLLFVSSLENASLISSSFVRLVPLDVSDVVRRFVEALFITHTETKLNTFGRLLHISEDPYEDDEQFLARGVWCRNVVFNHPQPR